MNLEVFDLKVSVLDGKRDVDFCRRLAECLHETSCLVVRDPRVSSEDNARFLDMMESYFMQPETFKAQQSRPKLHYQVGWTPGDVEIPSVMNDPDALDQLRQLPVENRPCIPNGPDPKSRYMWRIGDRPEKTAFAELNSAPVIPEGFEDWEDTLNTWGEKLLNTILTVAELLSIGLGLDDGSVLRNMMHLGPHLLSPTGVNVANHRVVQTCLAGYHSDLNLLTAHGKSRYPGLFIWLRNGERVAVKIPDGCLLLQAGMQLERLTGGYIRAGMHEVVVSAQTLEALQRLETEGKSTWRVSSTLFGHTASDLVLIPLGKFKTEEALKRYPPILAGEQVAEVLKKTSLF